MALLEELTIYIVMDILARLPSKSLLRLKCVCKSWLNVINSPKFIEFYRNQCNSNDTGHILVHTKNYASRESVFSLHCEHTFVEKMILEQHPFRDLRLEVMGCSNGLVCLVRDKPHDLVLWNPSIRKFKVLPNSMLTTGLRDIIAFGFVSRINDFKVFKMSHVSGSVWRTDIYSLSTNSWKHVENGVMQNYKLSRYGYGHEIKNVVDGVVHVMVHDLDVECACILWFDMANEIFGKIEIPKFYGNGTLHYKWLSMVSEEFWVVSTWRDPCLADTVDIWAMKKNSPAESWKKRLTLNHSQARSLGFWKNDEVVLHFGDLHHPLSVPPVNHRLAFYDPKVQEMKDFQFNEDPRTVSVFTYYTESLALLNEGN